MYVRGVKLVSISKCRLQPVERFGKDGQAENPVAHSCPLPTHSTAPVVPPRAQAGIVICSL